FRGEGVDAGAVSEGEQCKADVSCRCLYSPICINRRTLRKGSKGEFAEQHQAAVFQIQAVINVLDAVGEMGRKPCHQSLPCIFVEYFVQSYDIEVTCCFDNFVRN